MSAKIYLVGAGPGSADLLTVRAARIIAAADVILYDALIVQEVLDLATQAHKIFVGKRAGQVSTEQAFINRLLIASARDNCVVVRLKGGDPMIFGRAHEEIEACHAAGIEVEIVPGITAASAASAHIGVSLTRRGVSRGLTIVTPAKARGSIKDDTWADGVVEGQTLAIYMGISEAMRVRDVLLARGLSKATPIILVHNAGRPDAVEIGGVLSELETLACNVSGAPTVLLVGQVLSERVNAKSAAVLSTVPQHMIG